LSAIGAASPASVGDAVSTSKELTNTMIKRRIDIRSSRGQTMVEFALVVPILCLVLFGVIQFGVLYKDYVTLTDATRAGARKAAVSRHEADPVGTTQAKVQSSASGLDPAKLNVTVSAAPAWEHGADVTVAATYPYDIKLLGFVVTSGNLSSKTTERVE
jgi:Flp pilus assembly protein TadG